MSRIYGEPVQVWTRGGRPVRFVWRGRLYVVRRVVEHGISGTSGTDDAGAGQAAREFWRVEAVAGPGSGPAGYELRRDTGTDRWLLSWAWD